MKSITQSLSYFSKTELILWFFSVFFILLSFLLFGQMSYLSLTSSLIGVTALIFCAKGNPFGLMLMIVFCLLYTFISFQYAYYGEMITYLGMTLPMTVFSLVAWMKNACKDNKSEVKVNRMVRKDWWIMCGYTILVSILFYFILKYFNTKNLFLSTLSVTTSFMAVFLTFKRSPFYAIGYAINDIVLILLWALAMLEDRTYSSVLVCFIVFFINDIYGFINWRKIQKKQTLS